MEASRTGGQNSGSRLSGFDGRKERWIGGEKKRKESSESAFFSLSCPSGTNIGDYDFITPH